jgi:hypothetical protein
MLTIEYAKNPKYVAEDRETINLQVKFYEFDKELSFGATSFDPTPHGIELYNNAIAGVYGPIVPPDPSLNPVQPSTSGTQTL